jgi:hypothetical protein
MAPTTNAERDQRSLEIHQRAFGVKYNTTILEPYVANFFFVKKKDGKLRPV